MSRYEKLVGEVPPRIARYHRRVGELWKDGRAWGVFLLRAVPFSRARAGLFPHREWHWGMEMLAALDPSVIGVEEDIWLLADDELLNDLDDFDANFVRFGGTRFQVHWLSKEAADTVLQAHKWFI